MRELHKDFHVSIEAARRQVLRKTPKSDSEKPAESTRKAS